MEHPDPSNLQNPSFFNTGLRSVRLKPGKDRQTIGRHPWILDSSVVESISPPRLGEQVDVIGGDGKWIGRGLHDPTHRIRVRVYTWSPEQAVDGKLIQNRIEQAIELRRRLLPSLGSNAIRWIYSESDGLSGLIVDEFAGHLILQISTQVLIPYVDLITRTLCEAIQPISIVLQTAEASGDATNAGHRLLHGNLPEGPVTIQENRLAWQVDLLGGQKTGYYLDQRENRLAAARWVPERARVLDVCTYSGGFALTIAKKSPTIQVTAIDSSSKAIELAKINAAANGLAGQIEFEQRDFFQALSDRVDRRDTYDMIVLDPPKLAGARDKVPKALAAYHRLNYLACRALQPGGILVTCSCSGRVPPLEFVEMLLGVARRIGRELQILENRGAAPDHPTTVHCPETNYLKCVIARVL